MSFELTENIKVAAEVLLARAAAVRAALVRTIATLLPEIVGEIKDKLDGRVLHKVTGKLQNSVTSRMEDSGDQVVGVVGAGAGVKYAKIHEFGGTIVIHPRSQQVYFKYNKKLDEFGGFARKSRATFARWVTIPSYTIKMPERSYVRSTAREFAPRIRERLEAAVSAAAGGAA